MRDSNDFVCIVILKNSTGLPGLQPGNDNRVNSSAQTVTPRFRDCATIAPASFRTNESRRFGQSEACSAINAEINPSRPPFAIKGRRLPCSPLWKRGVRGDFLTMVKYHAVWAVMTVRAECPGLSTVLSYLFLQPLRAAH